MSFKKSSDGRVFFQTSNNNDRLEGESAPENILEQNQAQLQVLSLLRSLNERLEGTQEDREQFRKDLESYKGMVAELNKRSEKSDRAYALLEEKLSASEKAAAEKLKQATEQIETIKKDKAVSGEDLDKKFDTKLEERLKKEREAIKTSQYDQAEALKKRISETEEKQKQLIALQTKQKSGVDQAELKAEIEKTLAGMKDGAFNKDQFDALQSKIDQALSKNEQLERKVERSLEERARMNRKLERLEENLIQTHDMLNAKALVLLTDQSVATAAGYAQISASPDVAADEAQISAPAQARAFDDVAEDAGSRKNLIMGALLAGTFIAGLVGGWLILELQKPDNVFSSLSWSKASVVETTDQAVMDARGAIEIPRTDAALSVDDPFYRRGEDGAVEGLKIDIEDEQTMLEMMEDQPEALATELNKLEPSSAPAAPELAEQEPVTETVAAAQATQAIMDAPEPSVQSPVQRIRADRSLPAAIKPLEDKAFAGEPEAQHDLAAIYTAGHSGVAQDYDRAATWFREAADNGVANAAYNLGVLYHQGVGVDQSLPEAIKWYQVAARQGHPEAHYNLGIAYVEGIGVPYDAAQATKFFKASAEQGIKEASYNLGLIYENGLLGAADFAAAALWYKRAADDGSPEAQVALKELEARVDLTSLPQEQQEEYEAVIAQETDGVTSTEDFQRRLTRRIQEQLIDRGLYTGPADGLSGAKTRDAIRTYQSAYDMNADGLVSRNLLNHMIIHSEDG